MRSLSRVLTVALTSATLACASGSSTTRTEPSRDPHLITREEISAGQYRNAFEAVQALHQPWMVVRGTDSFSNPTQIWVYLNESKMGGVEMLKEIATPGIAYIRHFDGIAATARWGLDHGQGAIVVSTRAR